MLDWFLRPARLPIPPPRHIYRNIKIKSKKSLNECLFASGGKKEIKSGYAEIIKHALIKDYSFFCWLEKNSNKLLNLNKSFLEKAIYKSIMIKLYYVIKDEKEFLSNNNSRAMLNFGHTIGHAIESHYNYKKFNHGEAITIGMITEAKISNYLGLLSSNDLKRILTHFKKYRLKEINKISFK